MDKLLFASFNRHKLAEVAAILGSEFEVLSPEAIGYCDEPEENAPTLAGNALIKARSLYRFSKGNPCFADDTGLEVEALDGAPGVHSARYAGEEHDDKANRQKLLSSLKGFSTPHVARFRTVVALIDQNGEEHLFEATVEGEIITEERGLGGFGYDALFVPKGFTRTFAEMSESEKNQLSHRARAVEKLKTYLLTQR